MDKIIDSIDQILMDLCNGRIRAWGSGEYSYFGQGKGKEFSVFIEFLGTSRIHVGVEEAFRGTVFEFEGPNTSWYDARAEFEKTIMELRGMEVMLLSDINFDKTIEGSLG